MKKALKIGACFCAFIGVLVFLATVVPRLSLDDWTVSAKHIEQNDTEISYHILVKQASGFGYEDEYSKSFYELVVPGDRLRLSIDGYCQLIRGGRVIKYHVAWGLIILASYAFIAFSPMLIFIHQRSKVAKWTTGIFTATVETIVIAIAVYLIFILD